MQPLLLYDNYLFIQYKYFFFIHEVQDLGKNVPLWGTMKVQNTSFYQLFGNNKGDCDSFSQSPLYENGREERI